MPDNTESTAFAHVVYFTVKDHAKELQDRLVAGCHQHLTDHPGTLHFSAGSRAVDYQRDVNDQQFDVALILVFATEADHDRYQDSDRHQQFIAEFKACWSQVRVFDAFV